MADGSFCDYGGQLDSNMLAHMAGYGSRSVAENLGDGSGGQDKRGLGFYMEQMAAGMPVTSMEALGLSNMGGGAAGHHGNPEALLAASMMSQAAAAGMFDNVMNYAMKQEKGLPPTPPGSPEDPKDVQQAASQHGYHGHMHPASMVAMPSAMNPNLLAKPVPMRRLSEKRIAEARASMSSMATELPQPHHLIGGGAEHTANPALARALVAVQQTQKRPRSEKKAIPTEQKDGKYFERRKRNNNAAKKSRDARKSREDEIAIRASFLEKENAILRAQVTTLREEANSLRQLLLQKRSSRH